MGTTNFDAIQLNGAPVLPGGGNLPLGSVYLFVDSNNGVDAANRGAWDQPFATVDYAIGQCLANKGYIVVCKQGHAETIATAGGITLDVAGVSVLCLGKGAARPTLTLSAVGSSVVLSAASCRFSGFIMKATGDNTIMVDVNAADCEVDNLDMRSTTGKEFVTAIDVNGGAANACDRTWIHDCVIQSSLAAGASRGIELGEVADRVLIQRCTILGDYADAAIHNPAGKVLTNLAVEDCFLENTQTGDHAIELVSACTGRLVRCLYKSDMTQATASDPGSCFSFECYHDDVVDTSAIISPAIT